MIVMKVIAGIIGYIIISVIMIILIAYADRKAGEPAEKIYKDDNFNEYCLVGFLFPLSISCAIIAVIYELIKIAETKIVKYIKIICIKIIEKERNKEKGERKWKRKN